MKNQRLWLSVTLASTVVATALLGLGACSAPDPGEIGDYPRRASGQGIGSGGGGGGDEAGASTSDEAGTGGEGGTGEGGTVADNAFKGALPFNAAGAPLTSPDTTQHTQTAPIECGTSACHANGGGAQAWSLSGIIYTNKATTTLAGKGVEIVVRKPDNTFLYAYTDGHGRFALPVGTAIPVDSKIGIRNAAGMRQAMTGLIAAAKGAKCTSAGCHLDGTQPHIYLAP